MTTPTEPDVRPEEPFDSATLIEEGQGLVRSIALKVYRSLPVRMDLDDLIAYGQLGLAEAASVYDPRQRTRFTTFAYYRVRGAIYDGVSKMAWTSRRGFGGCVFKPWRTKFWKTNTPITPAPHRKTMQIGLAGSPSGWRWSIWPPATTTPLAARSPMRKIPTNHPAKRLPTASYSNRCESWSMIYRVDARRLVTSIYFEGFTLTQAAARCGISKSWASRLHAKSLDQLANSLKGIAD